MKSKRVNGAVKRRTAKAQPRRASANGSAADYAFICRASEKLSMVEMALRLGHADLHQQHLADLVKMFEAKGHCGYKHHKSPNSIIHPILGRLPEKRADSGL
jgi:hypothetical protein